MKNRNSLFCGISSIVFLLSFSCFSQELQDANDLITIDNYLKVAAKNNEELKAAFEQWHTALEQVPKIKVLPDPKFTYSYFIEEIETRTGPQKQKLSISQTFPWIGVIESRTDIAAANARSAYKNFESAKLELFYKVKSSFYEYAYLKQAIDIAKQNLELIQYFEEVVRARYTTSTGTHPDIIRAQIELAILQEKVESLEKLRIPIVAGLNSILNRENNSPLGWPQREKYIAIEIDKQSIIDKMIKNNPKLLALDFDIAAAKAGIELAKKRFYPDINIGLDWIQTDEARNTSVSDSGKDPIIAMFSLNIPIWTKSYKAAELQARAISRMKVAQKAQNENDLTAKLEKSLYSYEDSARKIKLYEDLLIPKAKEMLNASESAYTAGNVDFLSLIDSQRTLLEFQLSYEREVTNNLQEKASIEMFTGEDFIRENP